MLEPKELLDQGIVEFVLGAEPGSGAFVIGYNDDPILSPYMSYFKMGDGPLYLFYRPFHLTHLEAPLSVARAVLFDDATIAPAGAPTCEVVTVAKRDLEPGDELDGIGGFTVYGMIDNIEVAQPENALAMGLTAGARITRPVAADTMLTIDDVELPPDRLVDQLRREQSRALRAVPRRGQGTRCAAAGRGTAELANGARHAAFVPLGVNQPPPRRTPASGAPPVRRKGIVGESAAGDCCSSASAILRR